MEYGEELDNADVWLGKEIDPGLMTWTKWRYGKLKWCHVGIRYFQVRELGLLTWTKSYAESSTVNTAFEKILKIWNGTRGAI
ncbi:uncharacterized protein G2W53_024022 [Senna tora]|uniref:Uncharacterized protein n=1 Tax=Senna tora TaxID=362788 RepID=A0A834TCT5_9FABA|nr:uncharacterized protein G2W53_024022 [Senna tora]